LGGRGGDVHAAAVVGVRDVVRDAIAQQRGGTPGHVDAGALAGEVVVDVVVLDAHLRGGAAPVLRVGVDAAAARIGAGVVGGAVAVDLFGGGRGRAVALALHVDAAAVAAAILPIGAEAAPVGDHEAVERRRPAGIEVQLHRRVDATAVDGCRM